MNKILSITRKHSSRMRTVRCSGCRGEVGVLPGVLLGRGCFLGDVLPRACMLPGGCAYGRCVLPRGCASQGWCASQGGLLPGGCASQGIVLPAEGELHGGVCTGILCFPGSSPWGVCQTPPVNRMTDRCL